MYGEEKDEVSFVGTVFMLLKVMLALVVCSLLGIFVLKSLNDKELPAQPDPISSTKVESVYSKSGMDVRYFIDPENEVFCVIAEVYDSVGVQCNDLNKSLDLLQKKPH